MGLKLGCGSILNRPGDMMPMFMASNLEIYSGPSCVLKNHLLNSHQRGVEQGHKDMMRLLWELILQLWVPNPSPSGWQKAAPPLLPRGPPQRHLNCWLWNHRKF